MKKRRLLAVVTAAILLLALIPQAVLADPTDPGTSDDVPTEVSETSGTAESFTVTVACSAGGGYYNPNTSRLNTILLSKFYVPAE